MTEADTFITRASLAVARSEAQRLKIKLPRKLTAIRAGHSKPGGEGWFLVESRDGFRKEIWAFNAFDARAKAIEGIIAEKSA
jgi:hypothetical protein